MGVNETSVSSPTDPLETSRINVAKKSSEMKLILQIFQFVILLSKSISLAVMNFILINQIGFGNFSNWANLLVLINFALGFANIGFTFSNIRSVPKMLESYAQIRSELAHLKHMFALR